MRACFEKNICKGRYVYHFVRTHIPLFNLHVEHVLKRALSYFYDFKLNLSHIMWKKQSLRIINLQINTWWGSINMDLSLARNSGNQVAIISMPRKYYTELQITCTLQFLELKITNSRILHYKRFTLNGLLYVTWNLLFGRIWSTLPVTKPCSVELLWCFDIWLMCVLQNTFVHLCHRYWIS